MTRSKRLLTERKHLPKVLRFDLSDVPSKHRVTNATTTEPLSLVKEWAGCTHRPGSLIAFTLPSVGIRC